MIVDARTVGPETEFACDLCIVGAGPAGIAIADRLRDSGLAIVLLESGGFDPELPTQRLFRGESVGRPYYRLDRCRFRLLGGSTNRWGGWCRPLEPVDYERRDWLPWSGWPIASSALAPYHADAAKLFELSDSRFDLPSWHDRLPPPLTLDESNFESVFFQYSPETNFGETYRARLATASNVTTLIHANLIRLDLAPGSDRIGSLEAATLTGKRFTVRPQAVVLATGGLENARLLLASCHDRPAGLGNEFDRVGRFFMEHLHVPCGHLLAAPGAGGRKFYRKANYNGVIVRGVLTPTAAAQERHQLLSTSIAIEPASYSFGTPFLDWPSELTFGPVNAYRTLRSGRRRDIAQAVKRNAERLSGVPTRLRTWAASRAARKRVPAGTAAGRIFSLYFRSEQAPDPNSRVTLSERRDALGMPRVRLDWRVNPIDIGAITGWLDVFARDVATQQLGCVIAPLGDDWQRAIIGGPHHLGTTRMSADAALGVVDEHCRVHSVANLYVAGSSVFSTGGYANPTFTLVALALRLADTLRDRLREQYSVRSNP